MDCRAPTSNHSRLSPIAIGAFVLSTAIVAASGAGCSDAASETLRQRGGTHTASDTPGVDDGGAPSSTSPVLDGGGVFAEAGPEGTKAEILFRALQSDLIQTCGGSSGV